jgi:TonB family protein
MLMKRTRLSVLFVYSFLSAFSQSAAKIVGYFNAGWGRATEGKAVFYRTAEPSGDRYLVKDYYKSGQLQMEALCTAYEPKLIWKGNTKLYHENGAVSEEGMFENEERIGKHIYWYDDGKKRKEMFHSKEKTMIMQFWLRSGNPMLTNGNGTIRESESNDAAYMDIQDSIMVADFNVLDGKDTVYTVIPESPEYKGGAKAMMSDLRSVMRYPKAARKAGTQGRVFVAFVVDKQGRVRDASVLKGISPECDAESVRAVSTLNNWNPGRLRGKPVAVRFVLPINFAL